MYWSKCQCWLIRSYNRIHARNQFIYTMYFWLNWIVTVNMTNIVSINYYEMILIFFFSSVIIWTFIHLILPYIFFLFYWKIILSRINCPQFQLQFKCQLVLKKIKCNSKMQYWNKLFNNHWLLISNGNLLLNCVSILIEILWIHVKQQWEHSKLFSISKLTIDRLFESPRTLQFLKKSKKKKFHHKIQ